MAPTAQRSSRGAALVALLAAAWLLASPACASRAGATWHRQLLQDSEQPAELLSAADEAGAAEPTAAALETSLAVATATNATTSSPSPKPSPSPKLASPSPMLKPSPSPKLLPPSPSPMPAIPPQPPFLGPDQPMPPLDQILNNPTNCSGFMQPRVYIEAQAWFTPDGGIPDEVNTRSTHLHIGACVPHRQWVAGTVNLAILLQRHAYTMPDSEPVTIKVEFEFKTTNITIKQSELGVLKNTTWICENATDTSRLCKQVFYVSINTQTNTTKIPDGMNIMRLVANTRINDTLNARSIEARINSIVVVNNMAMTSYPTDLFKVQAPTQISTTGFPWAYTHAEFLNDIPLAPLIGNYTISSSLFIQTLQANVTGGFIAVDPAFHKSPVVPGLVLRNYTAAQLPNAECPLNNASWHVDCNKLPKLVLDTTQLNDTKWHKLFLRTDSFVGNNDPLLVAFNTNKTLKSQIRGGTFSAVTLFAFRTNNTGLAPANPQPAPEDSAPFAPPQQPPDYFSPPPGVTVFNGSQSLPPTNATLNIAANKWNCSGWLEPRLYQEGQAWLTRPYEDVDNNSSHIHVGACLPYAQKVAGIVPIDVLLQRHLYPNGTGNTVRVLVTFRWSSGNITFSLAQSATLTNTWQCVDAANCRQLLSTAVDTKPASGQWLIPDGLNQLMVEAHTDIFDGNSTRTISAQIESWVIVANNADTTLAPSQQLIITDTSKAKFPWAYTHANLTTRLPATPISGSWTFSTKHLSLTSTANVTRMLVTVDPGFHRVPTADLGKVLADAGPGTNATLCPVSKTQHVDCGGTFTLNTTALGLCNGFHRLFIRTDSFVAPDDPTFEASNAKLAPGAKQGAGTFSAITMTAFEVNNSVQPAACTTVASATSALSGSPRRKYARRHQPSSPQEVVLPAAERTMLPLQLVAYHQE